jgi:DNA-binding transcriptional LysR family regulator
MLDDVLRYFVVAARHEHLGRAAEQLGLSQPTLSRAISRLEKEWNVRLFERSGRRMRLNSVGRMLLIRAERILGELDDARRELSESKAKARQLISIGFLATFGVRLIPDLIRRFKAQSAGAEFRLLQGPFPLLHDRLVAGEIDLCLSSPRFVDMNIDWRPLFEEELVIILPRNHRLASRAQIDLSEIAREAVVAMKSGYGLRMYLDDLCREAGFAPQIAFEGEEVTTLHGLVGAGFGVAMVPKGDVKNLELVRAVSVRSPICKRMIGLSWRHGRYLPPQADKFKDYIFSAFLNERLT